MTFNEIRACAFILTQILIFPRVGKAQPPLPVSSGPATAEPEETSAATRLFGNLAQPDVVIELERKQIYEYLAPGLEQVVVVDPAIVSANSLVPGRIYIQGLSLGGTYIHVWTREGRRTLQVKVVPILSTRKRQLAQQARKKRTLKMSASVSTDNQVQENQRTGAQYRTQDTLYGFRSHGDTALGRGNFNFYYRTRDRLSEISLLATDLENRAGLFQFGDLTSEASPLVLPLFSFQGGRWISPRDAFLRAEILGGYTNRELWGEDIVFLDRKQTNRFAGGRVGIRPIRSLEIFGVGARASNDFAPERTETDGAGAVWESPHWVFEMEAARAKFGRGWHYDVQHRQEHWDLVLAQRSIDRDYVTVNGNTWARGQRGETGQLRLHGIGLLNLFDVRYDQYRTSYQTSAAFPGSLNRDARGQLRLGQDYQIVEDVLHQDLPGLLGAFRLTSHRTTALKESGRVRPEVFFRQESSVFYEIHDRDYSEYALGSGLRLEPEQGAVSGASFVGSVEGVRSTQLNTGEERTFVNGVAQGRVFGSWFFPQLRQAVVVSYQNQIFRFQDELKSASIELRNDFYPVKSVRIFLVGEYEKLFAANSPGQIVRIRSGLQWDTEMRILTARARRVEGSVFKDLNGDGIRQKFEPGIAGVPVILNERTTILTDAGGRFQFRPVRGEANLRLDASGLSPDSRLTSSNPQIFLADEEAGPIHASFAVAYSGEAAATFFVDANGNRRWDPDERRLSGLVLTLDQASSEVSNAQGQAFFTGLAPGEHELNLDVMALPQDYFLDSPTRVRFALKEGERKEVTFILRPARLLSGVVFWDKDANGHLDAEDEPLTGITLMMQGSPIVTDAQGKFYWDQIPPGPVSLEVAPSSLQGWEPAIPMPQNYQVPPDRPFVVRDVEIPLRKPR